MRAKAAAVLLVAVPAGAQNPPDIESPQATICDSSLPLTFRRQVESGECPDPDAPPPVPDRVPSLAEQRKVREAFDLASFDGPSARWRWTVVARGRFVCGQVNAKNRLGGYVGWTPFYYDLEDGTIRVDDGQERWFVETICTGKLAPVTTHD